MEQTKEQMYDILRKEGVIDCVLDTGCFVYSKIYHKKLTIGYVFTAGGRKTDRVLSDKGYKDGLFISYLGYSGNVSEDDISKVYGYELSYGRTCRWIEEKYPKKSRRPGKQGEYKTKLDDLRHRKDLPISEQENEEEILKFLVGL